MNMGIRRTLAGVTFGSAATPVSFGTGAVDAAGALQETATVLPYTVNNVGGVDGTTGVILPAADPGCLVMVNNTDALSQLLIYPPSGGTINGGTADAAIEINAKTGAIFVCTDGTNWGAIYTTTES
jgi:hypothetical protein